MRQAPIGTGLAFAHKYKQDGGVAMALYGDGASNQGQLYEAMNMAGTQPPAANRQRARRRPPAAGPPPLAHTLTGLGVDA